MTGQGWIGHSFPDLENITCLFDKSLLVKNILGLTGLAYLVLVIRMEEGAEPLDSDH